MGSERAAGRPIEPPRLGRLARRKLLVQPPWCYVSRQPLCAWEVRIQPALRLVSAQPAAEPEALRLGARSSRRGLRLSGGRGRPGTESRGTRFRGFGSVGGAASLCSKRSRRFQVWAPLRGFMYGSRSLICARATARNRTSGERRCCLSRVRSPGAEGGGAPWASATTESSLTSP